MEYDKYLFIELFRRYIERNQIPLSYEPYDLLHGIVTKHYDIFVTSNYNDEKQSLYDCINNYLLKNVNYSYLSD